MKIPQYFKALFYTLGESQFLKDNNPDILPVYYIPIYLMF